ncbi:MULTISPECIES: GGDEF domain-containing protein [unclassified Clostridioides]|uniref:GGDEF domain-containing protein n=1 Tax=unclassified Clostridioides TaxID=2635829 RepID=UPI001D11FF08|nr:GGDEF domain-containing protein [Clostridioides sp. ES-S-0001-02]MCC0639027.1 GGDEF domain-containing protein [Clostridioides sp. ES-S-0049-03]MCC0675417.1 GGDEF domain-containing protein [Clostridioides sp. ES-W-0018-02]MCC0709774.1 GGDEF domain-containing protein [Clostridioides sp. ES-W-0017-02]UDN60718.1 GGDEF domain-containing protein [Clostridioides sp. ES-W-0016-02]
MFKNKYVERVEQFINAYFVDRDVKKCMSFFHKNICWIGTGKFEVGNSIEEVEYLLEEYVKQSPDSFILEKLWLDSKEYSKNSHTVFGEYLVCKKTKKGYNFQVEIRITYLCVEYEGEILISSVHNSVANDLQKIGEYFPISLMEAENNRLEAIINEKTKEIEEQRVMLLEANRKLQQLAITDELTGLLNQRAIMGNIKYTVKDNSKNYAIMIIDIDNFKHVNDNYGHLVGDEVIRVMAYIIQSFKDYYLFAGRYGGDEFIVLTENIEKAIHIESKVHNSLLKYNFKELQYKITVSIGISEWIDFDSFEAFLSEADKKLYKAKKSGKNKTIY